MYTLSLHDALPIMSELDRDYDVVIIANVLHHVRPGARHATISRAAELLAGNGSVVVFEHNPANPLTRRAVRSCPFDEDAILLPPRETLGYFAKTGLKRIRLDYIVF